MFQILEEISELIYIVDLNTYDLLYINHVGRELFHIDESKKGKCYNIFYGKDCPCEFCTSCYLKENSFYTWEKTNSAIGRHFLLKDKLIDWEGKKARVEIAFDMTEQETRRKTVSNALELQNLVTECAKRLYEADQNETALDDVLKITGEYLHSDRAYIFEFQNGKMSNTYEWCAQGVKPQIQNLQNIPVEMIEHWKKSFKVKENVIIENIEDIKDINPDEYFSLKIQQIHSLIVVPLLIHSELIGYVGVDNFSIEMRDTTTNFLTAIGYFIASMLRQQRTLAQLEKLSYYDSLTGIKNRNAYMMDLKKKYQFPIGVIYIDVNGMKQINNHYGHKYGDRILCITADTISSIFFDAGCYRIGGDEFVVICEKIESEEFDSKVQQLKNYFEFHTDYYISLGKCWTEQSESLREIVFQADRAMFHDKKAFYRGHALSERYRCQTDDILGITKPKVLHEMIKSGNFHVYYQPQIDIKTQKMNGAEALVRFQNISGNMYSPNQFIPILEESRLISELDFYIFESVCAQLKEWSETGISVVPISTNFSRHTLAVKEFAERLQSICNHYNISQKLLEIEITETVEADNRGLFYSAMEQLNQRNFRISIDDFGVSNANLSLLTDVDFHVLKIDKHVIEKICNSEKSRLLVSALTNICHQMGIKLIVEGVETQQQLEILRDIGCDVAQGYLFSKPIPSNDFYSKFLLNA